MAKTPDRTPGVADEEGIILSDEGVVATVEGEIRFKDGVFSFKDASGPFDPRLGTGIDAMLVDDNTCQIVIDDITGNVLVNQ